MLSIKWLTHTLMLSEWEASALQEEFVPWHKERCDFHSAHIHLTHRDSRPWSRVMSSTTPSLKPPSRRAGLCIYLIRISTVQTARHSSKVERERGRVDKPGKTNNDPREHFLFLAEQRRSVRYFNKKVPREDSSAVFSVKCWASDVMALHTALPYDWTTQRRSQHSWLKCC